MPGRKMRGSGVDDAVVTLHHLTLGAALGETPGDVDPLTQRAEDRPADRGQEEK